MLIFLNLGGGEVFLVVFVIILLFGSDKMPELARGLGKGIRELNDAKNQLQNEIQKTTEPLKEEMEKHVTNLNNELTASGESIKRSLNEMSQSIADSGTKITDTLK